MNNNQYNILQDGEHKPCIANNLSITFCREDDAKLSYDYLLHLSKFMLLPKLTLNKQNINMIACTAYDKLSINVYALANIIKAEKYTRYKSRDNSIKQLLDDAFKGIVSNEGDFEIFKQIQRDKNFITYCNNNTSFAHGNILPNNVAVVGKFVLPVNPDKLIPYKSYCYDAAKLMTYYLYNNNIDEYVYLNNMFKCEYYLNYLVILVMLSDLSMDINTKNKLILTVLENKVYDNYQQCV